MSDSPDAAAPCACPKCDKPCAWTPERAGRRLRCTCRQVFRMPAKEGGRALAKATPPEAANKLAPKPEPSRPPVPETEPETQPYEMDLPSDMPEAPGMEPGGYGGVHALTDPPSADRTGTTPATQGQPRP